jgi:hypothetical protein
MYCGTVKLATLHFYQQSMVKLKGAMLVAKN